MQRNRPAHRTAQRNWRMILACTAPLWLAACDVRTPVPVTSGAPVQAAVAGAAPQLPATPPGPAGTSVPAANAVFAGTSAAQPDLAAASAPQARAPGSMTTTEASTAMPMPGQANDHSVPVLPPKPTVTR